MKLKKGDTVRVITGKDKGKEGVVQRVIPDQNKVIVSGVNIAAKHQRARRANEQGGIIDKDMPIHASNVALICGSCGATRVGYRVDDAGKKIRVCRKCQGDL